MVRPRTHVARMALAAMVAVGGAALGGCVQSRNASGSDAGPKASAAASARSLAKAVCEHLERCAPDALKAFEAGTVAGCVAYIACDAQGWRITAQGDEAVGACIQALGASDCRSFGPSGSLSFTALGLQLLDPSCRAAATSADPTPAVSSAGQRCLQGAERVACVPGYHCAIPDGPSPLGAYRCGVCEPARTVGETCGNRAPCEAGARCVDNRCAMVVGVGEACRSDDECQTRRCEGGLCREVSTPSYAAHLGSVCQGRAECGHQPGLFCDAGRCQPLHDAGEACDEDRLTPGCRLGQACVNGRCQTLGCRVAIDAPCALGAKCPGQCVSGQCQPLPDELGAPCTIACAGDLSCIEGLCAPAPDSAEGAPCDFDHDCQSRYCERDYSEYCSADGCSIPACDRCGRCAAPPTVADCR